MLTSLCAGMRAAVRLLLLALLVLSARARELQDHVSTEYAFPIIVPTFGFEEESFLSITLNYTPTDAPLRFLMCSENDLENLQNATISYLCLNTTRIPCHVNKPMSGGFFHLNVTNIEPQRYEFILANCLYERLDIDIDVLFLNADGEHLSTHEMPLVRLIETLLILWVLLAIAWTLQWTIADVRTPALHHVISLVPLVKICSLGASLAAWLYLSNNGHVATWITVSRYFFTFVFNVAFYTAILLVSRGWTVTLLSVPGQELRAYGVTVLGLALASLFYELIGRYYLFALLVMGVIYLRFALANAQTNIQDLKSALRIIRQHPGTTLELLLRVKTVAMKRFYRLLVFYSIGMGCALVLVTFFFGSVTWVYSNQEWLMQLLVEALQLGLCAGTCWIFRLRRIAPDAQANAPPPVKNSADDPAAIAVVPPYGRHATLLAVREDAVHSMLG